MFPPQGEAVAPGQTMLGVMATPFRRAYASTPCSSQDCRIPCPWSLLTYASTGDAWTLTGKSGSVSCEVTVSFSRVLVHTGLTVPSKSLFPQSCRSSLIKSHWLQSQIPWGFSVPLPDPQVGKSVMGPRTFATV